MASDVEVNRVSWCMDSHVISPKISEKIASYYWEIIYVSKSVQELLFLGHLVIKYLFSQEKLFCVPRTWPVSIMIASYWVYTLSLLYGYKSVLFIT